MYRTKLVCDDPVIAVMTEIDPQCNRPILGTHSALLCNNFASELRLKRGLLQNLEVKRLRLKGKDLAVGLYGSCQDGGRVTDVCADIQDVSVANEIGKGLQ